MNWPRTTHTPLSRNRVNSWGSSHNTVHLTPAFDFCYVSFMLEDMPWPIIQPCTSVHPCVSHCYSVRVTPSHHNINLSIPRSLKLLIIAILEPDARHNRSMLFLHSFEHSSRLPPMLSLSSSTWSYEQHDLFFLSLFPARTRNVLHGHNNMHSGREVDIIVFTSLTAVSLFFWLPIFHS